MSLLENAYVFQSSTLIANPKKFKTLVYKELNHDVNCTTLDVCCGTGNFSGLVSGEYLGVDLNQSYISYAKKKFVNDGLKRFVVSDIRDIKLEAGYFDNIMLISALHHLSDSAALELLTKINMASRGVIIITDPAVETGNLISRFLISLDRGSFVRSLKEQLSLIEKSLIVERHFTFHSGLASVRMIICRPTNQDRKR